MSVAGWSSGQLVGLIIRRSGVQIPLPLLFVAVMLAVGCATLPQTAADVRLGANESYLAGYYDGELYAKNFLVGITRPDSRVSDLLGKANGLLDQASDIKPRSKMELLRLKARLTGMSEGIVDTIEAKYGGPSQ